MTLSKKKISLMVISLVVFVLGWLGFRLGVFTSVTVTRESRGPYLFAYMQHQGAYHLVHKKIARIGRLLDEMKVAKTIPCAIFYDDPQDVQLELLRSEGGYLVKQKIELRHPFGQREIPEREVLVARVRAHPLVAPFKVYRKIVEYMTRHSLGHHGPALELYLPEGAVEVEMPFISVEPISQWPDWKKP